MQGEMESFSSVWIGCSKKGTIIA